MCIPKSIENKPTANLSRSEKLLTEWGEKSGFEVVCSQDPGIFDGDLDQFDAIAFYTSSSYNPIKNPISDEQKKKLLDAIDGRQTLHRHPLGHRYLPQTQ